MSDIDRAIQFASKAHEGQIRKYTGEPYFVHCLEVYSMIKDRGGTEEQQIAALLHDTVEDTEVKPEDILREFGPVVARLVAELTDQYTSDNHPHLNRAARKKLEADRLGSISDQAKQIKVCDLASNTSSIVEHDPGFAKVYLPEKAAVLAAMGY